LKYQQITHADVVAGNGDRVGTAAKAEIGATWWAYLRLGADDVDIYFLAIVVAAGEGVGDALGGSVETVADGVVVSVFIVVAHLV